MWTIYTQCFVILAKVCINNSHKSLRSQKVICRSSACQLQVSSRERRAYAFFTQISLQPTGAPLPWEQLRHQEEVTHDWLTRPKPANSVSIEQYLIKSEDLKDGMMLFFFFSRCIKVIQRSSTCQ